MTSVFQSLKLKHVIVKRENLLAIQSSKFGYRTRYNFIIQQFSPLIKALYTLAMMKIYRTTHFNKSLLITVDELSRWHLL